MDKVIFLVGPTGVGKTDVALALAKEIEGEIISADSMQVYRGMDIGTSKPSQEERKTVPHHLVNILEPSEEYSVADFSAKAQGAIEEILSRNKVPLAVGGSGLYVRGLIDGLFPDRGKDAALRTQLYQEAEEKGTLWLYERLSKVDPQASSAIHPHDLRRVVRALEVYERTKIPISCLRKNTQGIKDRYAVELYGLIRPRTELYKRIDSRAEKMFEDGLVEEVKRLIRGRLSQTAQQAIGYREIIDYLDGRYDFEEARRLLKRNTRRYAKRQLTWFRKDKRIKWIEIKPDDSKNHVVRKIMTAADN